MKLAIINGYSADARSDFRLAGIKQAEELFASLLGKLVPEAKLDVFFPVDQVFQDPQLSDYSGFLWTGSSGTIYHDNEANRRQIALMQAMLRLDRPVWGSCWGLQVAAVAAGGQVAPNRAQRREWMAARRIRLSEAGRAHRMFHGKPQEFDSFVMHLDEVVRLPEGAVLLASNDHSEVQAVELCVDRCVFWGTQYHPEFDFLNMGRLILARQEALLREGLAEHPATFEGIANRLLRLEELTTTNQLASEADFLAHPELSEHGRELDLHWSLFGRGVLEAELRNWVEHALKPSVAMRA